MQYRDPHKAAILRDLENETVSGTGEYLKIVVAHPVTMAGVFVRHLVNGMDQRYTTPYVTDLETHRLIRFLGFLIAFLALLRVCWPAARRTLGPAKWRYAVALLLSAGTSVASAIETRFMLPLFVLSFALVLAPGWTGSLAANESGFRRYRPLALASVAAALYFAAVWVIVSGASDNLHLV